MSVGSTNYTYLLYDLTMCSEINYYSLLLYLSKVKAIVLTIDMINPIRSELCTISFALSCTHPRLH